MTRKKIMLATATSLLALGLVAGPMAAIAQQAPLLRLDNNANDGPQGNAGGVDTPEGPNDKADRNDREDNAGGRDTDNVQEGPGNQDEGGHEDND